MIQGKLEERAYDAYFSEPKAQEIFKSMTEFARTELQKAAEIAETTAGCCAGEIRKLME